MRALALVLLLASPAAAQDDPAAIIAARLRDQGYLCTSPKPPTRDAVLSTPDIPVWVIDCGNAKYRVWLRADMSARVEVM
jgi:hypothetical protein